MCFHAVPFNVPCLVDLRDLMLSHFSNSWCVSFCTTFVTLEWPDYLEWNVQTVNGWEESLKSLSLWLRNNGKATVTFQHSMICDVSWTTQKAAQNISWMSTQIDPDVAHYVANEDEGGTSFCSGWQRKHNKSIQKSTREKANFWIVATVRVQQTMLAQWSMEKMTKKQHQCEKDQNLDTNKKEQLWKLQLSQNCKIWWMSGFGGTEEEQEALLQHRHTVGQFEPRTQMHKLTRTAQNLLALQCCSECIFGFPWENNCH